MSPTRSNPGNGKLPMFACASNNNQINSPSVCCRCVSMACALVLLVLMGIPIAPGVTAIAPMGPALSCSVSGLRQDDDDDPFAEPDPQPADEPDKPQSPDPEPPLPDMLDPNAGPKQQPEPQPDPPGDTSAEKTGDNSPQGSGSRADGSTESNPMPQQGSDSKPMGNQLPAAGQDEAFEKFRNLLQELQTNESTIKKLVVSMPIAFPDRHKEQQARVEAIRQRNAAIIDELMPLAIESFDKFPGTQQIISNYLLQNLQFQLTGKNFRKIPFNPVSSLESYQRLAEGGETNPVLHMFGYRIYYLLNDFGKSLEALKKAAAAGQPIDQAVGDDLRAVTESWNRELEFRRQDAEKENPRVEFEMDCGTMVVELFEDQAPNTVANFITLAEDGFYNGLEFFLVNPTEVAVAGSPTNDGKGGPGYSIALETSGENLRHHFTGVLAMLPNGQKAVASQFLITKQPMPKFNGQIPAFGRVIEGLENLYRIQVVNRTTAVSAGQDLVATKIIRINVLQKRDHDYVPEKMMVDSTPLPGG